MRREREAWAGHWARRVWSWEVNRKRGRLVAAAAVVVSVPLGGARCTAEGPGGTPLPIHMWAYWKSQNPRGDVKRTPHLIRPGLDFQLKGKTPLGQYVWYGPERPLSNSGP